MGIPNLKINAKYEMIGKAFIKMTCLLIIIGIAATSQETKAVTYGSLPNRPEARGFYYWLNMADYSNLLSPSMPLKVAQAYTVVDSVVKAMPSITYLYNPIKEMNFLTDTAAYICKFWYYMKEHDPLRFNAYLRRNYPTANNSPRRLYSELWERTSSWDPRFIYVHSDYILHIYVNNTEWIDTANTDTPNNWSRTIAYCKTLDTIKGGTFPSLDSAIMVKGRLSDIGNPHIIPQQTDVVFSYIDQWRRWEPFGPPLIKPTKPNPTRWVEPNKEYIVFLEFFGQDAKNSKVYYSLMPYSHEKTCSMLPVVNGIVLDEKDAFGFGKEVPLNIFKQNIRTKITDIKEYGE